MIIVKFSVEEQADGTHAVFCNGGFVKGGWPKNERSEALSYARDLADAAEEFGQKVEVESEPDEYVWLRDLDGTGSMHICTQHDKGAIRYRKDEV